jgi:hypothetical protein
VEDYRGEADGSFTVRFSAFGQTTGVIFGQAEARPPDEVRYRFSKAVSSEPLGELRLHFKAQGRETLVSGKLITENASPLPDPLQKLVEKGWLAFTLRQLKMLTEAGEIATTKGQPSGRDSNH